MENNKKEKQKKLTDYTKEELIILYLQTLLDSKKIVTSAINKTLTELGFYLVAFGTGEENEINSRELKTNFHGHDIAIGLAARAVSYGNGRRYTALVMDFNEEND